MRSVLLFASFLAGAVAQNVDAAQTTTTPAAYRQRTLQQMIDRPPLAFDNVPQHNVTANGLAALIPTLPEGFMNKVLVALPNNRTIGLLLWLPRGFHSSTSPWPTVWHLHGQAEGEWTTAFMLNRSRELELAAQHPENTARWDAIRGSNIASLVNHGLPHRFDERHPLNEQIVLVAPQCPRDFSLPETRDTGRWQNQLVQVELLRSAIMASSDKFDADRAVLTGLSLGATGVWAWAGFNPVGAHPWAGIAPMSGLWPYREEENTTSLHPPLEQFAISALLRTSIFVGHCANDHVAVVNVGAPMGPACVAVRTDDMAGEICGYSADAIVMKLREMGNRHVIYKRFESCPTPMSVTDSDQLPGNWVNPTQEGHDSWTRVYNSEEFVDWVLSVRRNGPAVAPRHRPWDLLPEISATAFGARMVDGGAEAHELAAATQKTADEPSDASVDELMEMARHALLPQRISRPVLDQE